MMKRLVGGLIMLVGMAMLMTITDPIFVIGMTLLFVGMEGIKS